MKDNFLLDDQQAELAWLLPEHSLAKKGASDIKDRVYLLSALPDGKVHYGQARLAGYSRKPLNSDPKDLEMQVSASLMLDSGELPEWSENQTEFIKGCCEPQLFKKSEESEETISVCGEALYLGEREADAKHLVLDTRTALAYFLSELYASTGKAILDAGSRSSRTLLIGYGDDLEMELDNDPWLVHGHSSTRKEDRRRIADTIIVYGVTGEEIHGVELHFKGSKLRAPDKMKTQTGRVLVDDTTYSLRSFALKGSPGAQLGKLKMYAQDRKADAVYVGRLPQDPQGLISVAFAVAQANFAQRSYHRAYGAESPKSQTPEPDAKPKSNVIITP